MHASWGHLSTVELAVPEASGITCIGRDRFIVVDDDRGVYAADASGSAWLAASRDSFRELRDLEGVCLGPDRSVWVLSERSSAVYSLAAESLHGPRSGEPQLGAPTLVGELESIAKGSKKGWEGLTIARAGFSDGEARVLACHEAKPRAVGVFDPRTLETLAILELPKPARKALGDVSDLTPDPSTGHILLLSDESAAIGEVEFLVEGGAPVALRYLGTTKLSVGKKEKPEGLCFDPDGRLWVVTDGDPHLRCYARN